MTDQESAGRTHVVRPFVAREWAWHSLLAGMFMAALCLGNFLLHARFPNLVAWMPAGAALALTLLLGPRMLPALVTGSAAGLILAGVALQSALLSVSVTGLACLLAWILLCLVRPVDFTRQTVSVIARVLLTGCAVFAVGAYLAGPAAISHLILHNAPPAGHHIVTAPHPTMHDHGSAAALAAKPLAADEREARNDTLEVHGSPHVSPHGNPHGNNKGWLETLLIDAIGVLLVLPLVMWFAQRKDRPLMEIGTHWRGACFTLTLLTAIALAIYSGYLERSFGMVHTTLLVLPPAVWLALEYGVGYTLLGNVLIFLITGIGTSLGYGPFKDHSAGLPLMSAVILTTTLLMAASRAERKQAEATIQHMATHDFLTGVTNRIAFTQRVEKALDNARRYEHRIAILFIDLNRFKDVNDTLGHQVGDLLLVEIARRLLGCLRSDSVLARFGGDEFVILIDRISDKESVASIAERIAHATALPCTIREHQCQVGCSIGISLYPDDGTTVPELMRKADAAMYRIKNQRPEDSGFMFYSVESRAELHKQIQAQV